MKELDEIEAVIDKLAAQKKAVKQQQERHSEVVTGIVAVKDEIVKLTDKISSEVEVKNWPEEKEYPTELDVKVLNFPAPEKIDFPRIPEYPKEIKVSNFPEQKEFPKKIKVSVDNFPEPEKQNDYSTHFTKLLKGILDIPKLVAEKARQVIQPVEITNEDPLRVILIDEEGRKYKAGAGGGYVPTIGAGTPIGLRDSITTGQEKIAVTGTAIRLPNIKCKNGVLIRNGGTTNIIIGGADVANTADGTGNGMVLGAKETTSAAVVNLNQIYINGTATTSWISYIVT